MQRYTHTVAPVQTHRRISTQTDTQRDTQTDSESQRDAGAGGPLAAWLCVCGWVGGCVGVGVGVWVCVSSMGSHAHLDDDRLVARVVVGHQRLERTVQRRTLRSVPSNHLHTHKHTHTRPTRK
jgi:hypothetical protein